MRLSQVPYIFIPIHVLISIVYTESSDKAIKNQLSKIKTLHNNNLTSSLIVVIDNL